MSLTFLIKKILILNENNEPRTIGENFKKILILLVEISLLYMCTIALIADYEFI